MAQDPFAENPFAKDPLHSPPPQRIELLILGICSLIGLFAMSNASMLKLMEVFSPDDWGAFWVYLSMGGMCAQMGLLTIWGAIGMGRAWQRQLTALAFGAIGIASWGAGQWLVRNGFMSVGWNEISPVLGFPLLLLATQLPLWIFRVFGWWRIVSELEPSSPSPQMSIAGILGAMTFIGAALALARLGMQLAAAHAQSEWWIVLSLTCAACAGICLAVSVPVCVLVLRFPWKQGVLLSLLYLLAVSVLAAFTAYAATGMRRSRPFGSFIAMPSVLLGFVITLLLPLVLLRLARYRLQWGRSQVQ